MEREKWKDKKDKKDTKEEKKEKEKEEKKGKREAVKGSGREREGEMEEDEGGGEKLTSYKQVKQRMPISQLSTGSEHFVDTFAGVLLYILEFTTEPIITGKYTRWNHRIRSTTSALIHKSKRPL